MRNKLIKIFMVVVLMIFSFCLYSQVFPPPENIAVDPYYGIVTWDPPLGMIYSDDFESYNVGEYLAVQSDYWTTWSNNPGSAEDAFISDDYALSETNSVKVDGSSDIVLIMDNYTSGCYSMELNMYIVSGNTANFNLQKTNTPGEQWAMEIYFYVNGEAMIFAGASAACVFLFDFDTWMNFEIIADLDNDLGELWFNGTQLHTWQWSLTTWGVPGLLSLGGMNMYAWASAGNNSLYYFDDVTFKHVNSEPSDELIGYNVYLDDMINPIAFTTDLIYLLTGLNYNQIYTVGVSAVYDDPGESIIITVTFCIPAGFYPPENLVATVFDYNDVHLEWEMERGTGGILYTHSLTKKNENNREDRILLGYKIYRDGDEIAEILDPNVLTYDDLALNEGTYEYWATAIYDYGESEPSNAEEVTIVLNPPQNLSAIVQGMNNVFLTWDEPATRDLDFYNVYRDSIQIGSTASTFYLDINVPAGSPVYNVTAVYDGGWESEFSNNAIGPFDVGDTPIPVVTELIGNYPNPFNPNTTISFSITSLRQGYAGQAENSEQTEICIYNLKGQKVKTLINAIIPNGFHRMVWDGTDENSKSVSSGIYFYKMKTGKYVSTKRMILMK